MSHLTPTPLVNKNGQTVIRHMKPEPAATHSRILPTVRDLMEPSQRVSMYRSLMAVYANTNVTEGELRGALRTLHEKNPENITRFHQYITTGHEEARKQAASYFKVVADRIIDDIKYPRRYKKPTYSSEPEPELYIEAQKRWNAVNVQMETGLAGFDDGIDSYFKWLDGTSRINTATDAEKQSDTYWRGVAALTLYEITTGNQIFWDEPEAVAQSAVYIATAGTYENLKDFVAVAIEREIIDAPTIDAIVKQRESTAASLYEGIL